MNRSSKGKKLTETTKTVYKIKYKIRTQSEIMPMKANVWVSMHSKIIYTILHKTDIWK